VPGVGVGVGHPPSIPLQGGGHPPSTPLQPEAATNIPPEGPFGERVATPNSLEINACSWELADMLKKIASAKNAIAIPYAIIDPTLVLRFIDSLIF